MRILPIVAVLATVAATAVPAQSQALQATLYQTGFSQPVLAVSPPGDLTRLFVVEQTGRIRIIKNGTTLATPFINLGPASGGGLGLTNSSGERGLLGLAFHPNYATNGFFYVNYTATSNGATIVRRYTVSGGNADVADTTTGLTLLTIAQPFSNHNGGCIHFGPDGKLYIGMGDGGSGNDPNNAGQTPTTLLGKMLRIDVDLPAPYIPADNPYATSTSVLREIWHFGVRNPWRFSFDRQTGDMYIGDVGQNAVEEISFQPAGVGNLNYGWRCMEGNNCTGLSGCTCNSIALTMPIQTYTHSQGCSVTGGFVYRGTQICGLQGTYFYADYCTTNIWSFKYVGGAVTQFTNRTTELEPAGTPTINNIAGFGEDAAGELYILDHADGEIYRIQLAGGVVDCNSNGIADACDIANGTAQDCNGNQIPDSCDISSGFSLDCNGNGRPDNCDITLGSSLDANSNGLPDECECPGGSVPATYCTGKLNSQLCLPTIAISGAPSASGAGSCVITASNIINNRNGLLFYGYGPAALPFQGGFICTPTPVKRTPIQLSGGTPTGTNCTGTFTFNFNAFIASGADPALQVVGSAWGAQYWSRDSGDPFGSSLTNAVGGLICQ
jgi:glucose/arabinose dehydrogenase